MPVNAQELAAAHKPYDAALPAAPAGNVVKVEMTLKDMTVEIAPGVKYKTRAFDGHAAPARSSTSVKARPSRRSRTAGRSRTWIDFHAARIAPDVAFKDVAPGDGVTTFRFKADDPGVFMYHCGTKPVLAHIANGMYGVIVVAPKEAGLPPVDEENVLVASEWYLNGDGIAALAALDMAKARAMTPDWTTFNGYANQYVTHPLQAKPGDTTRFWVPPADARHELPRRRDDLRPGLAQPET